MTFDIRILRVVQIVREAAKSEAGTRDKQAIAAANFNDDLVQATLSKLLNNSLPSFFPITYLANSISSPGLTAKKRI
jgi:hypothetical protein